MIKKIRDLEVNYIQYGKVEDVVLLHGWGQNIQMMDPLGKNIFDKNDPDYGMYEVKKGFGGKTVEYIGEFDLPINKNLYYLYKLVNKAKGRK